MEPLANLVPVACEPLVGKDELDHLRRVVVVQCGVDSLLDVMCEAHPDVLVDSIDGLLRLRDKLLEREALHLPVVQILY